MSKRFFVAKNNIEETVIKLESKGFVQLPDAGRELTKVVIDSKLRNFWLVDQQCFENNISIIKENHNETFSVLENEDLEKL